MDITHSFGYWVRRQRKALDLTQKDLAVRAACSLSAIKKIEQDSRRPSLNLAEALADSLAIPAKERAQFLKSARGHSPVDQMALPAQLLSGGAETYAEAEGNLPAAIGPIFGRDRELEVLHRELLDAKARLITLIGPGGIGKSRLALALARRTAKAFSHGAWFISLAGMEDPARLSTSIALALEISFAGPLDPDEQLIRQLQDRQLLLLLDNFEQLLPDGVDLISTLIIKVPQLTLLVTSRERLRLQAELTFPLTGIELEPARALFANGAKHAGTELTSEEDEGRVDEICRLVGGMPLALELTASWTRLLQPAEILADLKKSLDLLTGDLRDLPDRHRSIHKIFKSTWRRLNQNDQQLLARLTVFAGSFSREAAEYVCDADLSGLATLHDHSLIYRKADRFFLHELIRQFAAEELAHIPDEMARVQARHSSYFVDFLIQLSAFFKVGGPGLVGWHRAIDRDIVNIRTAWLWAIDNNQPQRLLSVSTVMWAYWDISGLVLEGSEMFAALEESVRIARRDGLIDDAVLRRTRAMALFAQGELNLRKGVSADQQQLLREEAVRILHGLEAPEERIIILPYLSLARMLAQGPGEAEPPLQEALTLAHREGHLWAQALAFSFLGLLRLFQGKAEEARQIMSDLDHLCKEKEFSFARGRNLINLGLAYHALGEYELAQTVQEEALQLVQQLPDNSFVPFAFINLAFHHYAQGHWERAKSRFEAGLIAARRFGLLTSAGHSIVGLGLLAAAQGNSIRAVELISCGVTQHDAFKVFFLGELERVLARIKEELSLDEFAAAEARGKELGLSEIIPGL